MTIEEKISHLQAASMEEARAQGNAIMAQHRTALEHLFEEHRSEALRQSETRIKAETTNAKQQLNMATSKAQIELKRELGKTQKELTRQLFMEVTKLLQSYMTTEDYRRLLVRRIEKSAAFASGEELTIYINPSDADKKEYLEEHTGLALTISKEDFVGGCRAVVHGRNILIDHSFKTSLESEEDHFLFEFEGGAGIE